MERPKRIRKSKRLKDFSYQEPEAENQVNLPEKREKIRLRDFARIPQNKQNGNPPQTPPPPPPSPTSPPPKSNPEMKTGTKKNLTASSPTRILTPMEKLDKLYTDPDFPSAYSGNLKQFLLQKESLSRHKRRIFKFKRRKIKVNGPYTLIQADTVFYRNYSRQNKGYKYILVVVDCFSRKNWCRPMKTTTADECSKNLENILRSMPYTPSQFASDQGNEFNSKHPAIFNTLVDKYGMLMFTLKGPHKASIVERFIRTLKSRIERFFTENNTVKWIEVLPKISEALNNSYQRSIGMTPNEVNFENRSEVFNRLYGAMGPPTLCKFKIGDHVRIPLDKDIFGKGYSAAWSKEIFKIVDKRSDGEVCYYYIRSLDGSEVPGKRFFYEQELNLVIRNEVP